MSTSLEIGDTFRDEVAELLTASGYAPQTEILIGHKRVDLVFSVVTFGKRRTYVVEAKNWSNPLTKTTLETIYGGYTALLYSQEANELLIVSPYDLKSPAAKAFIRDTPNVSHLSYNAFQESVLGFRVYLQTYVAKHERDGIENYYVSPKIEGGGQLAEKVDQWLQDEGGDPIAIIASYGMGKTSFAEHLTYTLAKKFLSGAVCRVPVLVRLGTISREQSIEGLIGSVLAGGNPSVNGYNYPIFSRLNAIGRFIIILDGFDEMKHMMTHAEFIANFDELNKLVDGAAKLILLGRPTAFLSESERVSVLRGMRTVGRAQVRARGAPSYQEITLLPFTPTQLRDFIGAYLTTYQRSADGKISEELIARRRDEIQDPRNEELLSRPIHARMMADIATDSNFDMAHLSRFALYDHFIATLIARELAKSGRGKQYKSNDRRSFACDLAWFLWTKHSSTGLGCRIDDLPDELFRVYIPNDEEINSAKRDLLSGSFLDEKSGGVFFFSHKSFQEFLVAEYIWSTVCDYTGNNTAFATEIVEALTDEVYEFLLERDDESFFRSLMSALTECHDGFSIQALITLCKSQRMFDLAFRRGSGSFSSWDAVILIGRTILIDAETLPADLLKITKAIADKADRKPMVLLAAINTLLVLGVERNVAHDILAPALIALLFARAELDLKGLGTQTATRYRGDALRDVIFEVVSSRRTPGQNELTMSLDLPELLSVISEKVRYPTTPRPGSEEGLPVYDASFKDFFSDVSAASRRIIKTFYARDADVADAIDD
ncbi:MAG: NACHT domain-containing protein [Caulobacteraceae bacterium]|nr:NACHT domain-containing protein [Caulobacteraceae bacterium]